METNRLLKDFGQHFGNTEGAFVVVSPGRVNLIGEHTDYNGGPVMPIAIDMCVEMIFRKNHVAKCVGLSYARIVW